MRFIKLEKPNEQMKNIETLDVYLTGHNGFVAGGCFKDLFSDKPPKDIDIFFENANDFEIAKSCFQKKYKQKASNDTCITFFDSELGVSLQLISKVFGCPEEVIYNFDFSVCKFAYSKTNIVFCDRFFEDLNKKIISIGEIQYPISTLKRAFRYVGAYGYHLSNEELFIILDAIASDVDSIYEEYYECDEELIV